MTGLENLTATSYAHTIHPSLNTIANTTREQDEHFSRETFDGKDRYTDEVEYLTGIRKCFFRFPLFYTQTYSFLTITIYLL